MGNIAGITQAVSPYVILMAGSFSGTASRSTSMSGNGRKTNFATRV
jgi:hypothetical protein